MRTSAWGIVLGRSLLVLCCFAPAVSLAAPTPAAEIGRAVAGPHDAPVVADVKAEIIILHATNDGKGIDPGIGKMPELAQPPFSSYNSYKLLNKDALKLIKGEAKEQKLPDGGKLAVTFKDMVKGKKGEATRYMLKAMIEKSDGKAFLPGLDVTARKGEYFFIAGQKYEKGILVIGIKIK